MGVLGMWLRSGEPENNVADNTQQKQVEASAGPSGPTSPTTPAGLIEPAPQKTDAQADNRAVKRQTLKPNRRPTGSRRTPETQMANHASNEIATDFMPLGDANALVLQEGGQIIRVKLPRSTLVRFGFPVNMDRYNENVKADVIVGVDGLARAIRFVQ